MVTTLTKHYEARTCADLLARLDELENLPSNTPTMPPLFATEADRTAFNERHHREHIHQGTLEGAQGPHFLGIDAGSTTRDMDMITEQVRGALSRTITRKFCENGQLRVVTLDAELEKKVLAALTKNEHGVYLALSPDIVQQIVQQVGELRKKFEELSQTPILLTSQIIRVYLSRMLATFYPDIYVLSFNEITSNVQIQAIGNITLQPQEKRA